MPIRMCDRCGQPLDESAPRYIAKIQVYAAYDTLGVSFDDVTRDHTDEIRKIVEQCKDMTEEELMRDVFVEFQFDLCRPCQRAYIMEPLPAQAE